MARPIRRRGISWVGGSRTAAGRCRGLSVIGGAGARAGALAIAIWRPPWPELPPSPTEGAGGTALHRVTRTRAGKQTRTLAGVGIARAPKGWRGRHHLHAGARERTAGQRTSTSSSSRVVRVFNRLHRWWRRHHARTGTGQQAGTPSAEGSGTGDLRRRRHGQSRQTAQPRLERSRNCALLAHRQSRRGRDHDHCGWANIHVPNSAY